MNTDDALAVKRLKVEFSGEETPVDITTSDGDVITVTPERFNGRIWSVVRVNGNVMGGPSLPTRRRTAS